MKVILHAGVHATDEDRLLKCLLRNADDFRKQGTAVPGPGKYRRLLSSALNALTQGPPAPGARDIVVDEIVNDDPDRVNRLIMSHESMFCVPKLSLGAGRLYPRADERLANARRLFVGDDVELFLALRNPATWLPAVYANTPHDRFQDFLNGCDPAYLRWSELIQRISTANPEMQITVWCNEDSPLIWGEIVRAMAGLPSGRKIVGAFDLLNQIMTTEGMQRFRAYLAAHPNMSEPQKRRVMMAFLDKFAITDAVEEELDIPAWSEDYVDVLSELYEQDMDVIAQMPNVTFILP